MSKADFYAALLLVGMIGVLGALVTAIFRMIQ